MPCESFLVTSSSQCVRTHEVCFIIPQLAHVQYSVSIKVPHVWQTHPSGRFRELRSAAATVSAALRFLAAVKSATWLAKRLFVGRDAGPEIVVGSETDRAVDGLGRSDVHASQQRKVAGFSSVQVGHVHGRSYELLSDGRSTGSGVCVGVGLVSGIGGGDGFDRGPAGLSSVGGMYEGPYFSRSSCWINSM